MNATISTLPQQWQRELLVSYKDELPKEFKRIQSMNICNISPNAQKSKAGPR